MRAGGAGSKPGGFRKQKGNWAWCKRNRTGSDCGYVGRTGFKGYIRVVNPNPSHFPHFFLSLSLPSVNHLLLIQRFRRGQRVVRGISGAVAGEPSRRRHCPGDKRVSFSPFFRIHGLNLNLYSFFNLKISTNAYPSLDLEITKRQVTFLFSLNGSGSGCLWARIRCWVIAVLMCIAVCASGTALCVFVCLCAFLSVRVVWVGCDGLYRVCCGVLRSVFVFVFSVVRFSVCVTAL